MNLPYIKRKNKQKNCEMKLLLSIIAITLYASVYGQTRTELRFEDKIRIREAMNISDKYGDSIWKGFSAIPFVMILVTDSLEFLINHPNPTSDFQFIEHDKILNTNVCYRARQFDKGLLATFPAVNGVNCIVVGTPENTNKNSTDWAITLLHEHFHHYQYSHPDYYESVDKLELSGGDKTGMWMLNYPFPYDSAIVHEQYKIFADALSETLLSKDSERFDEQFNTYKTERSNFKQILNASDYKYFSFQIWQEGIARFTEYKFLELLDGYIPSEDFSQLPGYVPFSIYKSDFYDSQMSQIKNLSLNKDMRTCFYAIGFAEGLLLDKLNPEWRKNYLSDKFFIERYSYKYD